MSLSLLPAEIHELIIDAIIASCPFYKRRNALSICSQVCKLWHSSSLRHTFHSIQLPRRRPEVHILRLMKKNSEIARCIRSVFITFLSSRNTSTYDDDEFEQICRIVSNNVAQLALYYQAVPDLRSRPLFQNGISLLLGSQSLSQLSFTSTFKSSFLENVSQNLAVLSFNDVKFVVLDHEVPVKLSRSLQKIEFWGSQTVIAKMQQTPGLSQIFERTQHFHIVVDPIIDRSETVALWDRNLIWRDCTSLDLTFGFLFKLNQEFFSYCEEFPWSSLSALKRLKINLRLTEINPPIGAEGNTANTPPWIAEASKTRLFLSGPSRLKTLKKVELKYRLVTVFKSEARVDQTLRELFHDALDPSFRRRSGGDTFPSLKNFDLCVKVTVSPELSGGGKVKEAVKMGTEKCLPSIFGPGGRCEVDGWAARVDVDWSVQ